MDETVPLRASWAEEMPSYCWPDASVTAVSGPPCVICHGEINGDPSNEVFRAYRYVGDSPQIRGRVRSIYA